MSTLNVSTIQSLTANTPPVIKDNSGIEVGTLCRAWVNFDGTGTIGANQSIRGSFNVSSVLKNGTGNYTITFTNALPSSNYGISGFAKKNTSTFPDTILGAGNNYTTTSQQLQIGCVSSGSAQEDGIIVSVSIFI